MTHLILFDSDVRDHLLPLTYSRPVGDLRFGILTLAEKWQRRLDLPVSFLTQDYLAEKFPLEYGSDNLLIDGSLSPDAALISLAGRLESGSAYVSNGILLMARLSREAVEALVNGGSWDEVPTQEVTDLEPTRIARPADLFTNNFQAIRDDFELLTAGRTSAPLSSTNLLIGPPENLFLEEGVTIEGCTINCTDGPVYFGSGSVILEGCLLRSPLAVNAGAVLKMGAKIYGGTTIGNHCKVGGEINNVVMQANSNKGHDGFLGNAAIGEWCNIGADTNASNLKNDYGEVKVWSYPEGSFRPTGLQFHGLVMGDHSKAGINTMFNTGTVVGFSSNVYGEGFPRAFIPSFSWGGAGGLQTYRQDKAEATAERVMSRRNQPFAAADKKIFDAVFEQSQQYRRK